MPYPKAHADRHVWVQHVQYEGLARMKKRIGTCSICGGDVMGERVDLEYGAHPDTCSWCGAVRRIDVIQMVPTLQPRKWLYDPLRDRPSQEAIKPGPDGLSLDPLGCLARA